MGLAKFKHNEGIFGKMEVNNYMTLGDLEVNTPYRFIGFFFNSKCDFPHYVLVDAEGNGFSLPTHLNSLFDEIREDRESIDEIKAGKAFFTVYEYEKTTKKGKKEVTNTYRSINVDVDA